MSDERELAEIHERYRRRSAFAPDRYSPFNPEALVRVQERQRVMLRLLRNVGLRSIAGLDVIEVGCGSGGNLLELIGFGADPTRLVGNELQADRIESVRERLPVAVRLHAGDATTLPLADASFDVVLQSTVFSSILDAGLRQRLAASMWRWLRPGGGVLWYDFTVNNPANRDVAGVPLRVVRELFPQGAMTVRRLTLAPPVARRVVAVHPSLYTVFSLLPPLRTHLLCWIKKP